MECYVMKGVHLASEMNTGGTLWPSWGCDAHRVFSLGTSSANPDYFPPACNFPTEPPEAIVYQFHHVRRICFAHWFGWVAGVWQCKPLGLRNLIKFLGVGLRGRDWISPCRELSVNRWCCWWDQFGVWFERWNCSELSEVTAFSFGLLWAFVVRWLTKRWSIAVGRGIRRCVCERERNVKDWWKAGSKGCCRLTWL
jgi:hypothetical protein